MSEKFGGRDYNLTHRLGEATVKPVEYAATPSESAIMFGIVKNQESTRTRRERDAMFASQAKLAPEMYEYLREQSELAYKVVAMHTVMGLSMIQIAEVLYCECDPEKPCQHRCGWMKRAYAEDAYVIGILMLREKWGATIEDCEEATRILNRLTEKRQKFAWQTWMTVDQITDHHDVSRGSVNHAIDSGKLSLQRKWINGQQRSVIHIDELREFLKARKVTTIDSKSNAAYRGIDTQQEEHVQAEGQLQRGGTCDVRPTGCTRSAERDSVPAYRAVA
jgi:hypothetical protein